MSDVSAVLLTTGEPTTPAALAAIDAQSLRPAEIIVVENVTPFHAALNHGVSQVTTPFFVQVDSDMILDPGCFRELREVMKPGVGTTVGELRDPMIGTTVGVKMFRTACFRNDRFNDSISPDTDFLAAMGRQGWKIAYAGRDEARTLGEHRPGYTPEYTYAKYFLEGGRLRYRAAQGGLRWRLSRLDLSAHELAPLATIALADGFFRSSDRDGLSAGVAGGNALARAVMNLLLRRGGKLALPGTSGNLREVFRRGVECGSLALADETIDAAGTIAALREAGDGWRMTVARLGYAYGLTSAHDSAQSVDTAEAILGKFLTVGAHAQARPITRLLRSMRYHVSGLTRSRRWQW
jgi:hypothetical protein